MQTQTAETVSLKDELDFSRNYAYLLQERFGHAYSFEWKIDESKLNGQKIIPVSVQTLIENAVKHNAGSNENPLPIRIILEEDFLQVENEKREKPQTRPTNQMGLENLKTRYALLSDKIVEVSQTVDSFKVRVPLIIETPATDGRG